MRQNASFSWIIPADLASNGVDNINDRYVMCGGEYSRIRRALSECFRTSSFESLFKANPMKAHKASSPRRSLKPSCPACRTTKTTSSTKSSSEGRHTGGPKRVQIPHLPQRSLLRDRRLPEGHTALLVPLVQCANRRHCLPALGWQQGSQLAEPKSQHRLQRRRGADETRRHGAQHSRHGPLELRHLAPAARLGAAHRCQREAGANRPSPQRANRRRESGERTLLRARAEGHPRVGQLSAPLARRVHPARAFRTSNKLKSDTKEYKCNHFNSKEERLKVSAIL